MSRLECSGVSLAYCNLCLLNSHDSLVSVSQVAEITPKCHHAWLSFSCFVETRSHYIAQADLQLLGSGDLPKLLGLQA